MIGVEGSESNPVFVEALGGDEEGTAYRAMRHDASSSTVKEMSKQVFTSVDEKPVSREKSTELSEEVLRGEKEKRGALGRDGSVEQVIFRLKGAVLMS